MRKRRGRGSKLGKFERMYFLNHPIPISSIAEEFFKFISRGLIFANSHFSKISCRLIFAKSQKINLEILSTRKLIHVRYIFLRMAGILQTRTISHYNTAERAIHIMNYSPTLQHISAPAVCIRTLAEAVHRRNL